MVDEDRLQKLLVEGFSSADEPDANRFGLQLAVAAQHRGSIAFERYGPETDADTTLISWSMAKSFTHALVGLLVLDGLLDPTAPADVPVWKDDDRREITLQHLLEMQSGLEFVEDYVDDEVSNVIEMLFGRGKDDVAGYASSFPLVHEPKSTFNYSSGTTNIVSAICGRAIEQGGGGTGAGAVTSYLQRRLFDPLGMSSTGIKCDAIGTFIGSSFLYATARDYLRFGQLYLQDGVWEGTQLLPPGWVEHARTPVSGPVLDTHWYGAHWWLWDSNSDFGDINGFAAHGYEGQNLVVVPDRELVIVRLGKTPTDRNPEVRAWLAEIIRCFPEC